MRHRLQQWLKQQLPAPVKDQLKQKLAHPAVDKVKSYLDKRQRKAHQDPNSAYRKVSDADYRRFGPMMEAWKPKQGRDTVHLRWLMTE